MRKFFILIFFFCNFANAGTVGIHLVSWHSQPGFNNTNPGLYYKHESGAVGGFYCNSESKDACKISTYIGYQKDALENKYITSGFVVAAFTGYKRATIVPGIAGTFLVKPINTRVNVIPPVKNITPLVINLALEF